MRAALKFAVVVFTVGLAACEGEAGSEGPAGMVGPAGPAGPQGAVGPAGPAGMMGPAGPAGPAGAAGPMGMVGPAGPDGHAGMMGPAGPAGAMGVDGPIGQQGMFGAAGPIGPAGPAGTTGQSAQAVHSTASITVGTATPQTVIPGMTVTLNVPAASRVLLSTDGAIQTTSAVATGFSMVDVFLAVDGAPFTSGGYQRIVAGNSNGLTGRFESWSMSMVASVPAGNHTFTVQAIGVNQAGAADATVGGPVNSVLEGTLNVVVLKQ